MPYHLGSSCSFEFGSRTEANLLEVMHTTLFSFRSKFNNFLKLLLNLPAAANCMQSLISSKMLVLLVFACFA